MNPLSTDNPLILLVEDNADHAFLATEAFAEVADGVQIAHVGHGEEALDFLRRQGRHAAARRPDLVLLDINMPRMNGFELMEAISGDPELKSLVVVALTTSDDREDVRRMYELGCRSYLRKPVGFDELMAMAEAVTRYWFRVVTLPAR
jgi:CheY-like chemotaxis protein